MDWQTLGMVSGVALTAVASLQAAALVATARTRTRKSSQLSTRRRQAFDSRLQTALQWAQAAKPMFQAWSGVRPFRVAAVVDEAIDCKSYYLVPEDGCPLPHYEPGQYLTFSLKTDPRQRPLVRCYSLSDRPREDFYRISVKMARPPVGSENVPAGQGSGYFHRRVQVGSTLKVQAPQGAFFLDPTNELPVVLIGGGIGLTPLLSMINSIAHRGTSQQAFVFAGFGNSREHPFREHLSQLAEEHENIRLDISYSRPAPSDVLGRDYHHRGRISLQRLKDVLPSSNFQFYVCGPPDMMQQLVPALMEWGVPESHIHFEAFGPASVKGLRKKTVAKTSKSTSCQVEFFTSGTKHSWDGSCESLLEFAEEQGVILDYGCRAGNCGQCLVAVREGNIQHLKEPGLVVGERECLTCIGVPEGDVVLEA